jgi:hypothetical protein
MQPFSAQQPPDAKVKSKARLTLILTNVIFGLLLVPGFGAMLISPLVFDAPDADKNPSLIAFTVALVSYPVLTLPAIIGSWILYAMKWYRAAIWVSYLPLLPLLVALLCFLLLER